MRLKPQTRLRLPRKPKIQVLFWAWFAGPRQPGPLGKVDCFASREKRLSKGHNNALPCRESNRQN